MNPGEITRPPTSNVSRHLPLDFPTSTTTPSLTPTSPKNQGLPVPSTTRPFFSTRSNKAPPPTRPFLVPPPAPSLCCHRRIAGTRRRGGSPCCRRGWVRSRPCPLPRRHRPHLGPASHAPPAAAPERLPGGR